LVASGAASPNGYRDGCALLSYDPYVQEAPPGVTLCDFGTLLETSDIVTLHAAPAEENRHLIDATALSRMKKTALLINTGRGWLVDYGALKAALQTGLIAGAALDVFEREPPDPTDALFALPNVLCTPHVAAWTFEGVQNVGWHGARNLSMVSGQGHADIVNPEARRA
jgi:D-3-phosphoglycerate dehydrogenase